VRKENPSYGSTQYQLLVSLRSRPDRDVVVFRVDTRYGRDDARTVYLDRATSPIDEEVLANWAQVVDDILASATIHRYGLQISLIKEGRDEGVTAHTTN